MKKFLLFICFVFCFLSCNKEDVLRENENLVAFFQTKASERGSSRTDVFFVTEQDIDSYISFKQGFTNDGLTRTGAVVTRLTSKTGFISAYLIDYDEGWEIIAADKRCQSVLAYSSKGSFNIDTMPPQAQQWLDYTFSYISTTFENKSTGSLIGLTPEESEHVDFWNIIKTRSVPYPEWSPENEGYPSGHWELTGTSQTLVNEIVNHLVPVNWSQETPYNNYCPLVSEQLSNTRSPAGCVAVAGAQLIYYLHGFLGVPTTTPTSGFVSGYAKPDGNYQQFFGDESSSAWALFSSQPSLIAMLIGKVGKEVGVQYASAIVYENGVTFIGSGGDIWSLSNYLLNTYGISWTWSSLTYPVDVDNIISSINAGSPVLVGAASNSDFMSSHAFLIDAWMQTKYRYDYYYEWVYDDPSSYNLWLVPCETMSTYSSPVDRFFGMNWGWGGVCDDIWFSPFGSWTPDGNELDGYRQTFRNFYLLSE